MRVDHEKRVIGGEFTMRKCNGKKTSAMRKNDGDEFTIRERAMG